MRGAGSFGSGEHTVVVGAGAGGLSAGFRLSQLGLPVTVVEKEEAVGGAGRTLEFMGCRFDLGPRPLLMADERVQELLRSLLGRELLTVDRVTRGCYRGQFFNRPVQLSRALAKLGPVEAIRCLRSPARAHEVFVGEHRRKVWGPLADELEDDVAGPMSSSQAWFGYPRRGAGQISERLADRIGLAGNVIWSGEEVIAVRHSRGRVVSVVVRDRRGGMMDVLASQFVSTVPIGELAGMLRPAPPVSMQRAAEELASRDLVVANVVVDRALVFPDQWIDVLDPGVRVARISNFRNFSRAMVADSGLNGLALEYFCEAGDAIWWMTDAELLELARVELVALGLCRAQEVKAGLVVRRRKAYLAPGEANWRAAQVVREWVRGNLTNLWLTEGRATTAEAVSDQAAAIASGLATAEAVARRMNAPIDASDDGWAKPRDTLALAGVGGYTEPAVPE